MIRVVIVDDGPELRVSLQLLLKLYKDIKVVGEATNGQDAIDCAKRVKPDLMIMDMRMPVMNGLQATRYIKDVARSIRVILISFDIEEYMSSKAR
jgi:YesN/AraC family two-component response regulator